jgi:hypothetical protein
MSDDPNISVMKPRVRADESGMIALTRVGPFQLLRPAAP